MTYGKLINGNIKYVTTNKIEYDGGVIIMPTEKLLNEHEIYIVENVNEIGVDHIKDNVIKHYVGNERTLDDAKRQKIFEIDMYDTSDAVNSFTYGDKSMWIDKATRVGLVNAVDSAILFEEDEITFGISDITVTLPCLKAKKMLAQLELYALKCYNTTLAHKNAVQAMTSIEDVDAFDVTTDYPEQLKF